MLDRSRQLIARARIRVVALTTLALLAFAGNSLLCRVALKHTGIDAASFTAIRMISGAAMLWLILRTQSGERIGEGNWPSAFALFAYAAAFSFAYLSLTAATGALILFAAVQITMITHSIWSGERPRAMQVLGFLLAFAGLIGLLLPGLSQPPVGAALLMMSAGLAWGIYSLRGKGAGDPLRVTTGNFLRTVPMVLLLSACMFKKFSLDGSGVAYALASGALTSGIGYVIWYAALPALRATTAATVQLSVPLIATLGGIVFLTEPITLRLGLAALVVLGGIALVVRYTRPVAVHTDDR
jgi:drug/metabolite transporter (DMT)-like permease